MADLVALSNEIKASGLKLSSICEKSGIPYYTLYRKMRGQGSFTSDEIVGISNAIGMSKTRRDAIFLPSNLSGLNEME